MRKVLITGARGFVGSHLRYSLDLKKISHISISSQNNSDNFIQKNINQFTDWQDVLNDVDTVIHLAAQVHLEKEQNEAIENSYYEINHQGTINLANQCALKGIQRFIYLSTIKVLGEGIKTSYKADDLYNPQDAYGKSKMLAEISLLELAKKTDMQIVILRTPVIYGPGMRANFLKLVQLVDKRFPLPLLAVKNQRSVLFVGNLIEVIYQLLINQHLKKVSVFHVADRESVSTPELIKKIANALNKKPNLFYCPIFVLKTVAKILGVSDKMDRLVESLVLDITELQNEFNITYPYTLEEGLQLTAKWYRKSQTK